MTEGERSSMDWVFAIAASLVLHAGIVGLFVMSGRPAAPVAEAEAPAPAAEMADAESDAAQSAALAEDGARQTEASGSTEHEKPRERTNDVRPQTAAATAAQATGGADASPVPEFYVVRQGDTLTKIARAHGTTPEAIAEANGKTVRQMDNIWVKQKIRLRK